MNRGYTGIEMFCGIPIVSWFLDFISNYRKRIIKQPPPPYSLHLAKIPNQPIKFNINIAKKNVWFEGLPHGLPGGMFGWFVVLLSMFSPQELNYIEKQSVQKKSGTFCKLENFTKRTSWEKSALHWKFTIKHFAISFEVQEYIDILHFLLFLN